MALEALDNLARFLTTKKKRLSLKSKISKYRRRKLEINNFLDPKEAYLTSVQFEESPANQCNAFFVLSSIPWPPTIRRKRSVVCKGDA